jgi:hypothetical protein
MLSHAPVPFTALCLLIAGCPQREERACPDAAAPATVTVDTPAGLRRLAASIESTENSSRPRELGAELAARLVRLSLGCVDREYPNKPNDVKKSDDEAVPPRGLHPAFYGCFDWHSAVHGHWTLVRVLRTVRGLDPRVQRRIRAALHRHLNTASIKREVAYFEAEHHKLFERPYGWGWLLRLAAELHAFRDDPDARRWAEAVAPLERLLVRRTEDYLRRLSLPVRAGTHHSTAFALAHMHDYAVAKGKAGFRAAVERASRRFYEADRGCPTDYEPSGEDFISPCLAEADLMRRVLPPDRFDRWLGRFLPPLTSPRFRPLLRPPEVRDRHDPKIGHLIGLSLQRGWTMRGVAAALPPKGAPRREVLVRLADLHRDHGLRLMFDSGYGGSHWLATFAVFLLTSS